MLGHISISTPSSWDPGYWARRVDQKKVSVAARAHGLELTPRWNGTGNPPLCASPPFVGAPALETTHPFHFKMCPSMLLGPMCNHDLGVLLRLPPATTLATSSTSETKAEVQLGCRQRSILFCQGYPCDLCDSLIFIIFLLLLRCDFYPFVPL